ncbi:MAG: hypothetical protein IJO59_01695 [Clostridia bacterium]|nr:hypothetical protein [Clostridia bacterium]
MHDKEQKRKKRFLIIALFLMVWILLPLCVVATYTWLSISKTPKVSDMEMTINSGTGLELAWSVNAPEEEWGQQLNFTDAVTNDPILLPVTRSQQDDCFYAARFGADGRIIDVGTALSDDKDANGRDGYYVKFTLYARTDENVRVQLKDGSVTADGNGLGGTYVIGTPVWDAEETRHADAGRGAQYATRVGLRVTPLDTDGAPRGASEFYVYEPNADRHNGAQTGFVDTPSVSGAPHLTARERLIRQTAFTWRESTPVEHDVLAWEAGAFEDEATLFTLDAQEKVQLDVYVWLEGNDADCVNAFGSEAALLTANLQFEALPKGSSGLVPIP